MSLFKRKPVRKLPFPFGYTLDEFRASVPMVTQADGVWNSPLGRHMMAVLYNGTPWRGLRPDMSETAAAIELGRREGYNEAIYLLHAMTVPLEKMTDIPIDYGASETDEKE